MVRQGIVHGHVISNKGTEVDKAKVDVISNLSIPKSIKDIRSFLGHTGFYRHFVKDFSKIARPLTTLLGKVVPFNFNSDCVSSFECLKNELISSPIICLPNWDLPFEIICDASNFMVGTVLVQCINKILHIIYYASMTLKDAQITQPLKKNN